MFGKNEETKELNEPTNSLVSRTTEIVGDIHFSGELIIEGRIKGNIYAEDDSSALIRVLEKGSVEGEICVPSVIINGLVKGDVRSTKHIELAAKAVVAGNVYYKLIEMVLGSEVNGHFMLIGANEGGTKRLSNNNKKFSFDSKSLQKE